ncbi:MAG: MBL fold metallo-hydrolase [Colwellia sp.]|nr:MBL fold metallo-hydrolase [Colwellia sp.]
MKYLLTGLALSTMLITVQAKDFNADNAYKKLQKHYVLSDKLNKFSLSYNSSRSGKHQSYDYNTTKYSTTTSLLELDLSNELFYQHSRSEYPGEFVFEFKHFKNDKTALDYDVNGVINGKRVAKLSDKDVDHFMGLGTRIIDFLAVKALFSAAGTTNKIPRSDLTISYNDISGDITIRHQQDKSTIDYNFNGNNLNLSSIHDNSKATRTVFEQYKMGPERQFASAISIYKKGKLAQQFNLKELKIIEKIKQQHQQVPMGYGSLIEKSSQELSLTKIANNLYLVTTTSAGRNVLVNVQGNDLIIFGAPISDLKSQKTITLLESEFPRKKIKYVYVTHAHSDHIGGLRAYAKHGATILADVHSIEAIKTFPRFEQDIAQFKFNEIKHLSTVADATFHIPGNSHAKGQSIVYFADAKIIYEADFLEIPFDNTIPSQMPMATKTFINYVHKHKLEYARIVGHHRNNDIKPAIVKAYSAMHMGMMKE